MKNLCAIPAVIFLAFVSSTAAIAQSAKTPLKPGDYITERGWGNLTVKPEKSGTMSFTLQSLGANFHTCDLEGELRNGKATLEAMEKNAPCVVTMTATPQGIEVKASESGTCQYYCGARAQFEGLYLATPPGCDAKAVAASRKSFKQLYDAKKFAEARARLEPVLKACGHILHWLEDGRIRNDLAVTLHKLDDLAACRTVLQPLADDAASTDDQVRENFPPSDAEAYLPIVKATRTNLKLCREK